MALSGTDEEKLKELVAKTHKEQGIWFLNAFWNKASMDKEAEKIWKYTFKFIELDLQKHETGNTLDELNAHRFLEAFKEPLTVVEMRDALRKTGAIPPQGKPKDFPITHFLLARFQTDWRALVNASQGDNAEEIARCQKLMKEIQDSIPELQKTEAEAKVAAAEQAKQQKIYDDRTAELQRKTNEGGAVQQNKAKAELAQHLAQDPLPLSRAKITAEAAAKRAERAVTNARAKIDEIEKQLKELALKSGSAAGALWWIERELHDAKQFMPSAKGGRAKDSK
jgi:hypothetical protein